MKLMPKPLRSSRLIFGPLVISLCCQAVGGLVILGWVLNLSYLTSVIPGLPTMKMNTAVCFLLAGVSLLLFARQPQTPNRRRGALFCAALVGLIGLLTLLEYGLAWDLGIDELLWRQPNHPTLAAAPVRMAPITALVFLLLGISLWLLSRESRISKTVAQALVCLTALLPLIRFIGYLYDVHPYYPLATFSAMAFHTAVTGVLLCLGILLLEPDQGLMASFMSPQLGGVMARRLLPFVIILPILVGWLRLLGQRAGYYDTALGAVLQVISFILSFGLVLWLNARASNQIEVARVQAESGLRESEERLRLATEAMQMGMWDRDLRSNRLFWSPSMERMMGFAPGSFPGTYEAFAHLVHPEDRPQLIAAQQQARNNSGHYQTELRFLLQDGQVRWGLVYGQMLFNAQGAPQRMVGVDIDITERKRVEEALRESEERFRTLVEQASDAFFVHDTSGNFLDVNQRACESLGYTREELLQMNVMDVEADISRSQAEEAWAHVRPGQSATLYGHQRRRNGTLFPVEIRWSCFDFHGERLFLDLVRDITERERAAEALRESELRYRELAESLPQLVWTCVGEGPCDYLSPQWVAYTGRPAKEQLGYGWLEQIHPDDREATAKNWELASEKKGIFDEEFRIRRFDGAYHWFRTRAVPICDEHGQVLKWFGSNTDIEDIKQAQEKSERLNTELEKRVTLRTEELAAANRELEAFAYSVSHDLRAPLRAIDGFSRILMEDYGTSLAADATEYLQLVRENTQRMGQLIDDLLNFSRLNRQAFNPQHIDPSAIVRAVLAELEHERQGRQIELSIEQLPSCYADAMLLKQVYVNLLTNAFKFTQHREIAIIKIGSLPTNALIPIYFVQDNGVGFDMKYNHKLFQVFQRLHRAEDYEGTGVGLAIVHRIIQRHGGRIWAESLPNQGTTFYFTLAGGTQV